MHAGKRGSHDRNIASDHQSTGLESLAVTMMWCLWGEGMSPHQSFSCWGRRISLNKAKSFAKEQLVYEFPWIILPITKPVNLQRVKLKCGGGDSEIWALKFTVGCELLGWKRGWREKGEIGTDLWSQLSHRACGAKQAESWPKGLHWARV